MRGKEHSKYCKETKKYCYSSEAKATRAKNKYENIRRVYFCESCGSFHTTKMGENLAIKEGIIKPKKQKKITPKTIEKRLEKLKKRVLKKSRDNK